MKPKKEDEKVKRKQASEAIKDADNIRSSIEASMARPVAPMVRPAVAPTASNPAMDEMRNADLQRPMANKLTPGMKNGGAVKSSRGDGIAQRGKTRGKMC